MNKVNLASFSNPEFNPGSKIKLAIWYFTNIVFFKSSFFPIYKLKVFLLKLFGATVGNNVLIKPNVNIKYPWLLNIGSNVWIGENVWIDNLALITIGNNVCISQGAFLLCGNHNYNKQSFDLFVKPIVIKDGVWICAKATITPGITCESHSIVGVGAVLQNDTLANSSYGGNPAIKIKDRIIS